MKRALIVIDLQNEYVTGNLKICFPDLMTSIPNIEVAWDSADDHGVPVVVVQHLEDEGAPVFARGSSGAALHESIADRTPAHLITKGSVSAFPGTDLEQWLRANAVDTVTIAGYMTQHCCAGTARDAAELGFTVEFLSDATGTLDLVNEAGAISADALHRSVLVTMQSEFAAVATTEEWTRPARPSRGRTCGTAPATLACPRSTPSCTSSCATCAPESIETSRPRRRTPSRTPSTSARASRRSERIDMRGPTAHGPLT
jgi:nicotinamidase-related amidase